MKKLLFITIILASCSDDEYSNLYAVDSRVSVYVERFFAEAEERGKFFDRTDLIATIVDTPNGKPNPFEPGLYKELQSGQKVVLFDKYVFETNSDMENEVMVFHELGHWRGLHHCDPCPDTVIMNSHTNFYMYDPRNSRAHKDRREKVLDYFFSQMN